MGMERRDGTSKRGVQKDMVIRVSSQRGRGTCWQCGKGWGANGVWEEEPQDSSSTSKVATSTMTLFGVFLDHCDVSVFTRRAPQLLAGQLVLDRPSPTDDRPEPTDGLLTSAPRVRLREAPGLQRGHV